MTFELRIFIALFILHWSCRLWLVSSWTFSSSPNHPMAYRTIHVARHVHDHGIVEIPPTSNEIITTNDSRRRRIVLAVPFVALATSFPQTSSAVVQQAVGSGEVNCRANNNCLELGELDGALGWEWGGKDRCDPTNPRCGTDGKLRDIIGQPVPKIPTAISTTSSTDAGDDKIPIRFTHIVAIQIEIGRGEIGVLKIGLFGNEFPELVIQQFINFVSDTGFQASNGITDTFGRQQPTVSLQRGGIVTSIIPGNIIEFGVPIQSVAYARSIGKAKVDETFIPQPRPKDNSVPVLKPLRLHDSAGLISMPKKGLGYGGTGFESDDECYESAFLITANPVPSLDKDHIVIGQILDSDSMAFVERLANIPTKRGIRGVIPGQTSGPPLPKVAVREVQVARLSTY